MNNNIIINAVTQIVDTFSHFYQTLSTSINSLVSMSGLNVDIPFIGDWSLIGLMFGSAIIIFLVVSVLNWVNPL